MMSEMDVHLMMYDVEYMLMKLMIHSDHLVDYGIYLRLEPFRKLIMILKNAGGGKADT